MARNFQCDASTIAQTAAGALKGYRLDGTYIFQGIKYANAKRFQSPVPVKPWEGVKDALSYGYCCPLLNQEVPNGELMVPHRYWVMNENCQYLNIWTGSLSPLAKRPVMVWLHGGGFTAGSAIEQVAYDGENLSRDKDVVVVSLNHRLNIFGYFDLSAYGNQYADSANAGNEDIIAALQWIHENIANFGGDPQNVTVFGQSGGGMKVTCLLQMPAADGLFHKGIIQSGVLPAFGVPNKADPAPLAEAMFTQLGLCVGDMSGLESVDAQALIDAYNAVSPALAAAGEYAGGNPLKNDFYMGDPMIYGFREETKDIPLLIGSVMGEFAFMPGPADKYTIDDSAVLPLLQEKYGEYAQEMVPLYKEAYPDKTLADLLLVDGIFRPSTIDFIRSRAALGGGAVYSYLFAYDFPVDGGKIAWHCSEIPFIFRNTDKVAVCNQPGVSDRLQEQMSQAWVSFAVGADPNCAALPVWQKTTPQDEAAMIFGANSEVRHNHDHALMKVFIKTEPKLPFLTPADEDEIMLH